MFLISIKLSCDAFEFPSTKISKLGVPLIVNTPPVILLCNQPGVVAEGIAFEAPIRLYWIGVIADPSQEIWFSAPEAPKWLPKLIGLTVIAPSKLTAPPTQEGPTGWRI